MTNELKSYRANYYIGLCRNTCGHDKHGGEAADRWGLPRLPHRLTFLPTAASVKTGGMCDNTLAGPGKDPGSIGVPFYTEVCMVRKVAVGLTILIGLAGMGLATSDEVSVVWNLAGLMICCLLILAWALRPKRRRSFFQPFNRRSG